MKTALTAADFAACLLTPPAVMAAGVTGATATAGTAKTGPKKRAKQKR